MADRICDRLWWVGGGRLSDDRDCLVYALDLGVWVLVDCGAGPGWPRIRAHLEEIGASADAIHTLVLTHGHIDHIGAAAQVVAESGCRVVAHEGDRDAIESGDPVRTAASWYHLSLEGVPVDHRVTGESETLTFPQGNLELLHTPGHTPGSMVAVSELSGQRVLFGQDIHGPFSPSFGSDIAEWRRSMERVLALEADILCEGHFGVFRPADAVRNFIEGQLIAHR